MKTAICYYSRHHGNTLQVLQAMAQGQDVDLFDVTARAAVRLEGYDAVGFASGIYYGRFHEAVIRFARQYLPVGKDVFFVYTCGSLKAAGTKEIAAAAAEKGARLLGQYGCRGFDTFGPFKLVGGIAKGHPDAAELQEAAAFYRALSQGR